MLAAKHFPWLDLAETPPGPGAPALRSEVDARARGWCHGLCGYGLLGRGGVGGGVARLSRALPPRRQHAPYQYRQSLRSAERRAAPAGTAARPLGAAARQP